MGDRIAWTPRNLDRYMWHRSDVNLEVSAAVSLPSRIPPHCGTPGSEPQAPSNARPRVRAAEYADRRAPDRRHRGDRTTLRVMSGFASPDRGGWSFIGDAGELLLDADERRERAVVATGCTEPAGGRRSRGAVKSREQLRPANWE